MNADTNPNERAERYTPADIELKWQAFWEANRTFRALDPAEAGDRPKYYALDMFPYPSAAGLHVGHPEGYTATDIVSRYKMMSGFNVLHPMGWDAFGLPAEQHALQTGTHPAIITRSNVNNFRKQIKRLGLGYDWDREVDTTDPHYYRWTQWIFLQLHELGLAYQAEIPVWWCPELGTVLANEEVKDGVSERGGFPVERLPMRQWMLRITAYAERLLADLDGLDWPESIKAMQRHWIGRSEGAEVDFAIANHDKKLRVYTTRPDTLFGVTYMVLSPEHPLVGAITAPEHREAVAAYATIAARKSDLDRTDLAKEKSGVFTGAYAINPLTGREIPIWVADYVLISYGTGAIMAVPAHDTRDWEFAKAFGIDIIPVVADPDGNAPDVSGGAWTEDGRAINSGAYDGLTTDVFKARVTADLEADGIGKKTVNFRLRDWLFSRQRYWGEPIPIIHREDGTTIAVPYDELPLALPEVESYKPSGTGESPLATIESWVVVRDPETGALARRETNTMPQWAGSCWYYLRYMDPNNTELPFSREKADYWLPVDLYVGGAEHAVLHLLYARFWHKVMYDLKLVSCVEPFQKLVNQGMILGADGQKMSKSRGNVVNPDDIVNEYGADSMRLYEMFMGPLEAVKPWKTTDIIGIVRFLEKVWKAGNRPMVDGFGDDATMRLSHRTVRKVSGDIENLRFNTAISALMVMTNHLLTLDAIPRDAWHRLLLLLNPFAPHLAEELWERAGQPPSITHAQWPTWDDALCIENTIELVLQINGKVRARLETPRGLSRDELEKLALENERVRELIGEQTIKKLICVPDKLVNVVVG